MVRCSINGEERQCRNGSERRSAATARAKESGWAPDDSHLADREPLGRHREALALLKHLV